mmetsp:Transcript_88138/g.197134  ORF Transcript_88138/g.197134 Transcript_88138/m.197134 type:complete len:99 (+) Transcript_88138:3-299(+)
MVRLLQAAHCDCGLNFCAPRVRPSASHMRQKEQSTLALPSSRLRTKQVQSRELGIEAQGGRPLEALLLEPLLEPQLGERLLEVHPTKVLAAEEAGEQS